MASFIGAKFSDRLGLLFTLLDLLSFNLFGQNDDFLIALDELLFARETSGLLMISADLLNENRLVWMNRVLV